MVCHPNCRNSCGSIPWNLTHHHHIDHSKECTKKYFHKYRPYNHKYIFSKFFIRKLLLNFHATNPLTLKCSYYFTPVSLTKQISDKKFCRLLSIVFHPIRHKIALNTVLKIHAALSPIHYHIWYSSNLLTSVIFHRSA